MSEEFDTGEKNEDGTPKMANRMIEGSLERVDDHTVRLHLTKPVLSVPEDLYNYPTVIMHRNSSRRSTRTRSAPAIHLAEFAYPTAAS
jgi:peptide/nickel transport system substrate-binding protein